MNIIFDQEGTYEATLLAMLRAFNRRHTDDMTSEAGYVIARQGDLIQGMLRYTKNWNWVGIKEMHLSDDAVFCAMLAYLWRKYPDMGGIQHYTNNIDQVERLRKAGFIEAGRLPASTQVAEYVYLHHLQPPNCDHINIEVVDQSTLSTCEQDWWNQAEQRVVDMEGPLIQDERIGLVAMEEDQVLGGIVAYQSADTIHVWILVVAENSRKQGLGRALMSNLEDYARQRGVVQINLGTTTFQAKPFYERLGYRVVMTQSDFPKGYDCFTMVKTFASTE